MHDGLNPALYRLVGSIELLLRRFNVVPDHMSKYIEVKFNEVDQALSFLCLKGDIIGGCHVRMFWFGQLLLVCPVLFSDM